MSLIAFDFKFMENQFFDTIPLWEFFLFTIVSSLIVFEIGFRLGRIFYHKSLGKVPMESMVTAIMGLLAFVLAFTFGFAANRFENRRSTLQEEANAILTTYLRSKYLPEPYRKIIPPLLNDYVNIRLEVPKTNDINKAIEKSESIHQDLWNQVVLLVEEGYTSDVTALFIESVNQVLDLHSNRVLLVSEIKVPNILWVILLLLTLISMGSMGYIAGFRDTRNLGITLLVIISFSSIIYLIADLEHSQTGFIKVSQRPLINTLKIMQKDLKQ